MPVPYSEEPNLTVSNNHKIYQSTGSYNTNINFGGEVPSSSTTGIHDTDGENPSLGDYDHWREYNSWKTTTEVTSNANLSAICATW